MGAITTDLQQWPIKKQSQGRVKFLTRTLWHVHQRLRITTAGTHRDDCLKSRRRSSFPLKTRTQIIGSCVSLFLRFWFPSSSGLKSHARTSNCGCHEVYGFNHHVRTAKYRETVCRPGEIELSFPYWVDCVPGGCPVPIHTHSRCRWASWSAAVHHVNFKAHKEVSLRITADRTQHRMHSMRARDTHHANLADTLSHTHRKGRTGKIRSGFLHRITRWHGRETTPRNILASLRDSRNPGARVSKRVRSTAWRSDIPFYTLLYT